MGEYRALCEFCGEPPHNKHRNESCTTAVGIKARKDYDDGWETGYWSPYYPVERRERVLANIEKVSPHFVCGYKRGAEAARSDDLAAQQNSQDDCDDDWPIWPEHG